MAPRPSMTMAVGAWLQALSRPAVSMAIQA
jgi:hypothetical protein